MAAVTPLGKDVRGGGGGGYSLIWAILICVAKKG